MKKLYTLSIACLLAASLALFVGCGNNGTISGNYKDVTSDEDWNKAAAALNSQTIFGDQTEENWKFGFDCNADFNLSMKIDKEKVKSNGDFEYLFAFARSETDTPDMTGAGRAEFSINLPAFSEEKTATNASLNGNLYNDNEKFYIDGAISEGENEISGKYYFDISQIFGDVGNLGGILSFPAEQLPVVQNSLLSVTGGNALKAEFDEMKLKLEADFSKGTKLKISPTDEAIELFTDIFIHNQGGSIAGDPYNYKRCVFETYLHLDENGMFVEAAMNININLDYTLETYYIENNTIIPEEKDCNFTLKGSASIKATAEMPVLPEDLDTYKAITIA